MVVGSRVRVLKIADFLARDLPQDEFSRLQSMVGHVFVVDEIDEYGGPWVTLEIPVDADHVFTHSLMLDADEMELVDD